MKQIKKYSGFTLVELLVSMTIFSMILVSTISIFIFASQMSTRVELNRSMQENMKNVMEDIAEWVRKNELKGISPSLDASCTMWVSNILSGSAICIENSLYTLWKKDTLWVWRRVGNIVTECQQTEDVCHIVRKQNGWNYTPMTNSFMAVQDLEFIISNQDIPKLTIVAYVRPAIKKWMSSDIIQQNTLSIQTTISQRLINTK